EAGDENAAADAAPETADTSTGTLVINEIRAVDADWIELYNPGPGPVALGGLGLTQARGSNGPPDAAALLAFPSNATLASGSFLLVVGKEAMIGGPFTDCAGLTSSCYWVSWGVSASGGEAVYIVSVGTTLTVVEQVTYPMPSAAPAPGRTYGRIPDGTGGFTSTAPTPAAPNAL